MMPRIAPSEPTIILYRPLKTSETADLRCFCQRPATWEKHASDVSAVFCDRHWQLWRRRFEADPGPCRLYRSPSAS